jgi:hypothetical protein
VATNNSVKISVRMAAVVFAVFEGQVREFFVKQLDAGL